MMMMKKKKMMIWGSSRRANARNTDSHHDNCDHFGRCWSGINIDTYQWVNPADMTPWNWNAIPYEWEKRKTKWFFVKKWKTWFFFLLVSDHDVTLNCFTVRAHFFDFPIDFFWVLPPSLYADEVLCAASRAALPPHMLVVFRKNRKWRNSMQVHKTLF